MQLTAYIIGRTLILVGKMINIKRNKKIDVGDVVFITIDDSTKYSGVIIEKHSIGNNIIDFKIKLNNDGFFNEDIII